jgi:glycine/D-amino acid oxidase-like deaminating enzyme/nitrite reductase/ring-hydroxylating ferredoxin subunit
MRQEDHRTLWWDTVEMPHYPTLDGDVRADVAIVGAGITGLTAARLLVREGQRVALLEQGRVGCGTTGGTSAHVTQVPDTRYRKLLSKLNRDDVRTVVDSSRAALELIASLVEEDGIDCDFARIPAYLYTESPDEIPQLEEEIAAAHEAGMPATLVREIPLPFPVAAAVRFEDQARFHPLSYLAALAREVARGGGWIYEGTRVVEVDAGEPCRVRTEHGSVMANTVLFATHTPAGFSLLHAELEPYRSYVVAARLRGSPPPDGLYFDTADPYNYTRRQGELLIVGGRDHKTGEDRKPEESYRELEEYVRRRWNVESIDYRWSAQFYEPPDGLPMIGRAMTSKHVYVATGYSGVGLVFGTLGGMLLTDFALGRDNPWAEVYRPARIKPLAAGPQIVRLGLETAASLVRDRVNVPKIQDLSEVPPGEGRVVEIEGERVAVYRDESGAVQAVSPVCTHAFCIVHWNPAERTWDCPCHGSRFGVDGGVLEGPAVKGLEPVEIAALMKD